MKRESANLHAFRRVARVGAAVVVCALLAAALPARASDAEAKASEAVANVLFDFDGSNEFVSYHVREDGFVDAVFAGNTPDRIYNEVVEKLRANPAIKGVLAGRGGPTCSRF